MKNRLILFITILLPLLQANAECYFNGKINGKSYDQAKPAKFIKTTDGKLFLPFVCNSTQSEINIKLLEAPATSSPKWFDIQSDEDLALDTDYSLNKTNQNISYKYFSGANNTYYTLNLSTDDDGTPTSLKISNNIGCTYQTAWYGAVNVIFNNRTANKTDLLWDNNAQEYIADFVATGTTMFFNLNNDRGEYFFFDISDDDRTLPVVLTDVTISEDGNSLYLKDLVKDNEYRLTIKPTADFRVKISVAAKTESEVTPDEPEITPEEPVQPEVTPEEPDQPEVTPEEPETPEVTPEEPDQPEVTPEEPDQPEVVFPLSESTKLQLVNYSSTETFHDFDFTISDGVYTCDFVAGRPTQTLTLIDGKDRYLFQLSDDDRTVPLSLQAVTIARDDMLDDLNMIYLKGLTQDNTYRISITPVGGLKADINIAEVVTEQEPETPEVTPEEPETPEVTPEEPETPEVTPEEPETPEVTPEEPETPEVTPEEPETPEVTPEEPEQPEVTPEGPEQPEVTPEGPETPEVTPEEPETPEVTPEEPDQPEVTPEEPDQPEVTPEEPETPEVTPEEPETPEVTPEEPETPEVTPEEPETPEVTPEVAFPLSDSTKLQLVNYSSTEAFHDFDFTVSDGVYTCDFVAGRPTQTLTLIDGKDRYLFQISDDDRTVPLSLQAVTIARDDSLDDLNMLYLKGLTQDNTYRLTITAIGGTKADISIVEIAEAEVTPEQPEQPEQPSQPDVVEPTFIMSESVIASFINYSDVEISHNFDMTFANGVYVCDFVAGNANATIALIDGDTRYLFQLSRDARTLPLSLNGITLAEGDGSSNINALYLTGLTKGNTYNMTLTPNGTTKVDINIVEVSQPEVTPEEPDQPEITPEEPDQPEVTPEEPETPEVTPEEPETPEVTPEEPEQPEVTPEEPEQPEVTPEEPEQPEVTPEEPETPEVTPEEPETPEVTPEEPETPEVTPEEPETPEVTPEEPETPSEPEVAFPLSESTKLQLVNYSSTESFHDFDFAVSEGIYTCDFIAGRATQALTLIDGKDRYLFQLSDDDRTVPLSLQAVTIARDDLLDDLNMIYLKGLTKDNTYRITITPVGGLKADINIVEVTPEEPDQPEVTPEEPEQPEVTPEEPDQPEVTPEEPEQPEVTPEEPEQPEVTPEEPETPEVTPEEPDQPEVTPEEPETPEVTPEEPDQPEVTPEEPETPEVTPEEPETPEVTPEEPDQPEVTPEEPDDNQSAITDVTVDNSHQRELYTLGGIKVADTDHLKPGIYIEVFKGQAPRKVYIRTK